MKFVLCFGIIVSIIAIVCLVIYAITKDTLEEKKQKTLINIGTICLILGLGFCLFSGVITSSNTKKDDDVDVKKEIEKKICTNKTDDYHKCSWSVIEDRCVCKQR